MFTYPERLFIAGMRVVSDRNLQMLPDKKQYKSTRISKWNDPLPKRREGRDDDRVLFCAT